MFVDKNQNIKLNAREFSRNKKGFKKDAAIKV